MRASTTGSKSVSSSSLSFLCTILPFFIIIFKFIVIVHRRCRIYVSLYAYTISHLIQSVLSLFIAVTCTDLHLSQECCSRLAWGSRVSDCLCTNLFSTLPRKSFNIAYGNLSLSLCSSLPSETLPEPLTWHDSGPSLLLDSFSLSPTAD